VFQFQSQDFTGTQAVEEHEPDQCEITESAETSPELGDFFGRERHDDPPILSEAKSAGKGRAGPAVAEGGSLRKTALKMYFPGGDVLPGMEAIAAAHCAQAMIYGLGSGFGIAIELMLDILHKGGLGDLGQRQKLGLEPAGEIEEVVGVDAERAWRELAEALSVQEGVRPLEFSPLVVTHSIG
jgi:hypothetical protein